MKYRQKPIEVQAFQFTEKVYGNPNKWPEWVEERMDYLNFHFKEIKLRDRIEHIWFSKDRGPLHFNEWLVKNGENSAGDIMSDELFKERFEEVGE